MVLLSMAYLSYAVNGYGMPGAKLLGRVLESASEISFLLLLILLAKGYTVTRSANHCRAASIIAGPIGAVLAVALPIIV
jgi:uncharacterized membrane protein